MGKEGVVLENGIHITLIGRQILDGSAAEQNISRLNALQPCDAAQQRSFAAPRGPKQCEELPFVNGEGDILQNMDIAVVLVQIDQCE